MAVVALAAAGCGGEDEDDERRAGIAPPGPPPPAACAPRADPPGQIAVRPRWSPGDARKLTIERTVEGAAASKATGRATGEIRVVKASGSRATLRYRTGSYYPAGLGEIPPEVVKQLEEEIPGPTVEYATARDGRFLRVENRAAIRRQALKVNEAVQRRGLADELEPEELARINELTLSDVFLNHMAGDPIMIHRPYGFVFPPGVPVDFDQPMTSPFGTEPIPAHATYEITSAKNEHGCVAIDGFLEARSSDVARAFIDAAELIEPGEEPPDIEELEGARASEELHYEFDPVTGWIVRAEQALHFAYGETEQVQRTVISLR